MDYKILLADDSVTVQKIITLTFKDEGVEVVTADNGDEAINRLQYLRPDLVMADVSIPGKNGYEICEFIKKHPDLKDTPVVLLVPAFEPFDEERAQSAGVDRYLTKPIQSISTLISTVMGLIEPERRFTGPLVPAGAASAALESKGAAESGTAVIVDVLDLADSDGQSRSRPGSGTLAEADMISPGPADLLHEFGTISAPVPPEKLCEVTSMDPVQSVAGDNLLELAIDEKPAVSPIKVEEDLDSILELDDVLADIWGTPPVQNVTIGVVDNHQIDPSGRSTNLTQETGIGVVTQGLSLTLSQSSIDEIVSRVVAQLTERLPEILSRELAGRIVPEVTEIIQSQGGQRTGGKAAYHEADSLLELDEI